MIALTLLTLAALSMSAVSLLLSARLVGELDALREQRRALKPQKDKDHE